MFIQVRCSNPGHAGRARAGRQFINGQTYRIEVVEDPPRPTDDGTGKITGWPLGEDAKPDMSRIDPRGYAQIKADPVLSVLEGGAASDATASQVIADLREQLSAAQSDLSEARATIANLEAENAALKAGGDDKGNGKKK